jgi:hypothetical protein
LKIADVIEIQEFKNSNIGMILHEKVKRVGFLDSSFVPQWVGLENDSNGLFILERVGSSPEAQVVSRLEDEGHWKLGILPKTRKLEMDCSSNFRCKLKEKGHGPLDRWANFFYKLELIKWTLFSLKMEQIEPWRTLNQRLKKVFWFCS